MFSPLLQQNSEIASTIEHTEYSNTFRIRRLLVEDDPRSDGKAVRIAGEFLMRSTDVWPVGEQGEKMIEASKNLFCKSDIADKLEILRKRGDVVCRFV